MSLLLLASLGSLVHAGKHILNKVDKYFPSKSGGMGMASGGAVSSHPGSSSALNEMHLMASGGVL